ncbi:hypothetical protein [Phyllobacterium zundukense]|nr:hypothetical protein [Phyllobacterium zundukense]
MHDFTLVLAFFAIIVLAYQAEVDDRPAVRDENWELTDYVDAD